ncbi:MAG: hypothetical protein IV088_07510 [Hydrogenophaga sp.]|uniref:hypothetical protein n=1 Tax=Hydrogenophaga sp. TaxID=1904254 RepID=UPI0025BD5C25|nr:hypothetical protein [Hydrogenophaga sp.]MBT9550677.1 hypothetical protein [Hydrogenophaga sp.]
MKTKLILAACLVTALTACAMYPQAGNQQADTPPQLVVKDDVKTWDHPRAFGPVPAELQVTAATTCSSLNTDKVSYEPRGYHAQARNVDGTSFQGGGYYCVPKH